MSRSHAPKHDRENRRADRRREKDARRVERREAPRPVRLEDVYDAPLPTAPDEMK